MLNWVVLACAPVALHTAVVRCPLFVRCRKGADGGRRERLQVLGIEEEKAADCLLFWSGFWGKRNKLEN
jgi:hypothetical protein